MVWLILGSLVLIALGAYLQWLDEQDMDPPDFSGGMAL